MGRKGLAVTTFCVLHSRFCILHSSPTRPLSPSRTLATSAEAVEPPGQGRWREDHTTSRSAPSSARTNSQRAQLARFEQLLSFLNFLVIVTACEPAGRVFIDNDGHIPM
jgi:hypothetical protein